MVKFSVYLNRRVFVMGLIDKMHCLTRSYITDAFVTNVALPIRQVVFEYRSEHYENMPIQIYRKFHLKKKLKIFDKKLSYFSYFCSKHRLWVLVRTASVRRF